MRNRTMAMLLQMTSPALPVGAFAYSQGIERAVEDSLIRDARDAKRWILDVLHGPIAHWEIPVWLRLHRCVRARDFATFARWNDRYVASRETSELRAETLQMGASLQAWARDLRLPVAPLLGGVGGLSFVAGFAACAAASDIAEHEGALAYVWSWIENQVTAAIKAVPLGQMAAQRLLHDAHGPIDDALALALALGDEDLFSAAPGLTLACARHETQYSRLFRS